MSDASRNLMLADYVARYHAAWSGRDLDWPDVLEATFTDDTAFVLDTHRVIGWPISAVSEGM